MLTGEEDQKVKARVLVLRFLLPQREEANPELGSHSLSRVKSLSDPWIQHSTLQPGWWFSQCLLNKCLCHLIYLVSSLGL